MNFRINDVVTLKQGLTGEKEKYSGKTLMIRAISEGHYIMKVPNKTAPKDNRELMDVSFNDADIQLNPLEVKVETESDGIIDIMAKNSKDEWVAILRLQDGELLRKKDLAKQGFSGLKLDFKGRLRLVTSY